MNSPKSRHFTYRAAAIALYLLISSPLAGQILVGGVIGAQTGTVSFDKQATKDQYKTTPYFGYHIGGTIAFRLQKTFYLQSSLVYSLKGKHMEGKLDKSFSLDAKYRYIEMPILFMREFEARYKGKNYKWSLGAGPTISYWLSGKGLLNSADLNENGINPPNYDLPYVMTFHKAPETVKTGEMNIENPNKIQLGLNFCAGIIVEPTNINKFQVTFRYELGHSFLSRDSEGDFGLDGVLQYKDDLQTRFQSLSLSVFYFIDLHTDQKKKGKSTSTIRKKKQ